MSLLEHFQTIFSEASDYLIKDDGTTGLAVFAEQPEDIVPRVTSYNGKMYTIQQIAVAGLVNYYPCTSLVTGDRYQITEEQIKGISFVSDSMISALNVWIGYHFTVFNAAKEALLSADVAKAKAVFNNPINGLLAFIQAMNADWIKESPETKPTDIIPGSNPAISYLELSARLEMWTLLEAYLNTAMPRTSLTPMQLLTKIK
jgi:hypothetical protein